MSFTHETLISALRDVIREEMKSLLVEIAKDESSDFFMELDRLVGLKVECNGVVVDLKGKVEYMEDHEDRIDSLERSVSDLEDGDDLNELERRVETLENEGNKEVARVLEMLTGIHNATRDAGGMW